VSTTATQDILLAARGVEVKAGAKLPSVRIVAYSGGLMNVPGWGALAIDLAGLDGGGQVRILADHDPSLDGVVGYGKAVIEDGKLLVTGAISASGEAAARIIELAKDGFEFQASVGVEPKEHTKVVAGERIEANGRVLAAPAGGFTLVKKGKLREVSIVSLGCDDQTAVAIAASKAGRLNPVEEARIREEERQRLARIEAACNAPQGWGQRERQVNELRARAVVGEISVEDLQAELLHILRSSRPTVSMLGRSIQSAPSDRTLEASLLMRLGREALAEKLLGPEACEQGRRLGAVHLLDLCRAALIGEGHDVPPSRLDMVTASLSTMSLPVALGNVANKLLLEAYTESPATWRSFAAIRSVGDFKENSAVKPSFTGQLEQVAPGGELKHGGVAEAVTTFKVDTFGKMLSLDRRDIINDDLSLFEQTALALGRMAMRRVSDLVYTALLANAGSFFSSGNGNLLTGADTALSVAALAAAIQAMQTQRDDEGNDLDIRPAVLLVPPELEVTAKEVLESEFIQRDADQPTGNSLRRAVKLEVEPRLSNTVKFASSASEKHWYLFAAPGASPMIVAFLNGKQTPTTEFFGLDQTVEKLCVSWRVYHDFGSALCDHRAAVRAAGE
jgi:hypothetical protein